MLSAMRIKKPVDEEVLKLSILADVFFKSIKLLFLDFIYEQTSVWWYF